MSLFSTLTRPVRDLTEAVVMPFKAVFVVGLCAVINAMTYGGYWWVKWVALGMGIATVVALARGARALLLLGLVAWVGWKLHQRHGASARAAFEAWVNRQQPRAAEVVQAWRRAGAATGTNG